MCKKSNVSRRTFLKLAGAGTLSAALSGSIIPGTIKHAFAAGNRPILIVLDFSGGVSNNIMPYTHAAYMNRMQGIFPGGNLTLGSAPQKLHPALASLYPIFQDGDMAVYNKVGYPNPNRSHAESHDIIWSGKRQGNKQVFEDN